MKIAQEVTELAVEARAGMLSAIWLKTDMAPSRAPWVKPRVKAAGLLRSDQTVCRGPGSLAMMVDWKTGATELAAELSAWTTCWRVVDAEWARPSRHCANRTRSPGSTTACGCSSVQEP